MKAENTITDPFFPEPINDTDMVEEPENSAILSLKDDLEVKSIDIAKQLLAETDFDKSKTLIDIFNAHQNKRNVLRILKLNNITDKVLDAVNNRLDQYSNVIPDKDLIGYLRAVQDSSRIASEQANQLKEIAPIQLQQTNNQVNINIVDTLDRQQRENVLSVINQFLKTAAEESEGSSSDVNIEFNQEENI